MDAQFEVELQKYVSPPVMPEESPSVVRETALLPAPIA
jgi:hypothetical protein